MDKNDYDNRHKHRVYSLEPVGFGSPLSESLPSYIMRLAMAHHITVGNLIRYEIVPKLGVKYYLKQEGLWNFYDRQERYNSSSQISNRLIEVLEELTGNKNLDQLIFNISESFGKQSVFKNKRTWCPFCLDKWKAETGVIYEPLIWNFSDIEFCKIHNYPLQGNCPNCGQEISLLAAKSIPGFCSKCGCWLGNTENYPEVKCMTNTTWHDWVCDNIAELLLHLPELSRVDFSESIKDFLEVLRRTYTVNEISQASGIPKVSLREWSRTDKRSGFRHLVNLSYCTSITLYEILFKKPFLNQCIEISLRKSVKRFSLNRKIIDYKLVEHKLDLILKNDSPPSITQIAQQLSVDPDTLRNNFPEKIRVISNKRKELNKLKRIRIKEKIREAVIQIHSEGKFPTTRGVIEALGVGYLFVRKGNVDTYKSAMQSLGLLEVTKNANEEL
ncbi:MAG: TniQ family protein [Desulfitobacterium sp.]